MTKAHAAHNGQKTSFPVARKDFFRFAQSASAKPASAKSISGAEAEAPAGALAHARLFQHLTADAVTTILA